MSELNSDPFAPCHTRRSSRRATVLLALILGCSGERQRPATPAQTSMPTRWKVQHVSVSIQPMRVLPNGSGSEVVFSVFQLPGASDAKFTRDIDW
jgi:hypothetical protein